MAKDKVREYFYAGLISVGTREPTAFFCGVYEPDQGETFIDMVKAVTAYEANKYDGEAVLTAFNKLEH